MKLPKEQTHVELFKGKEGIKNIFQDIVQTGAHSYVMGSIVKLEKVMGHIIPQYLKNLEKAGLKETLICDRREKILLMKTGTYRYLDGNYMFPSTFIIYGLKVAIFIQTPPYFGIVINNKDVADSYMQYFKFFWKIAKP